MKKTKISMKLSPGEAELLEIFWQNEPLTVSRVHEIYSGGSGVPALQTIQTRLNRMVAKNLLRRENTFPATYAAAIGKKETQGKFFTLLEKLAGNNFAPLLLHLAENRPLTSEEIQALEQILEKQKKKVSAERKVQSAK